MNELEKWSERWKEHLNRRQRLINRIFLRAFAHYQEGEYSEAIIKYKEAIELVPREPHAYLQLASVYKLIGRYEESIDIYQHLLAIEENSVSLHTALAESLYEMRRFSDSIEHFETAIQQSQSKDLNEMPHIGLGEVYSELGDFDTAIHHFEIAIQYLSNPNVMNRLNKFGNTLWEMENNGGKLEDVPKHSFKIYSLVNRLLADALLLNNKINEAIRRYQLAIRFDNGEKSYWRYSIVLIKIGEKNRAEDWIKSIPSRKSNYGNYCYGFVLYKLGKYSQALEHFKRVTDDNLLLKKKCVEKLFYYLARAMIKEKQQLDDVLNILNRVIGEKKNWSKSYYRRGEIYLKLSPPVISNAIDDFKLALELNSTCWREDRLSDKKISQISQIISSPCP